MITDPSQVVHPVDAYQLTSAERAALSGITMAVLVDCVRSYGLAYESPAIPPMVLPPHEQINASGRHYGLFDPKGTWYDGYAPREDLVQAPPPPPQKRDAVWQILSGTTDGFTRLTEFAGKPVPEGGCDKVGSDAYYAQGADIEPTLRSVTPYDEPRLVAAYAVWSKCMKAKGFDYASPGDAQIQDRWRGGRTDIPVSEEERATARADVQCKLDTNLVGIVNAVEVAYEKRWIERNALLLTENRTRRDDVLRRAATM